TRRFAPSPGRAKPRRARLSGACFLTSSRRNLLHLPAGHLDLRDCDGVAAHLSGELDVVTGMLFQPGVILVCNVVDLAASHEDVLAPLFHTGDHAIVVAQLLAGVLDRRLVGAAAHAVADRAAPGLGETESGDEETPDGEAQNPFHSNLLLLSGSTR